MTGFRNTLMAAALGLALASGSARAAIISGTWTFSASGFANGFASPGAFSGSFTFSFDGSADIVDSTALTVNSLTPNPFGPIGFTYFAGGGDVPGIGGLVTGAGTASSGTVDFLLVFGNASTAPSLLGVPVANGGPPLRPRG